MLLNQDPVASAAPDWPSVSRKSRRESERPMTSSAAWLACLSCGRKCQRRLSLSRGRCQRHAADGVGLRIFADLEELVHRHVVEGLFRTGCGPADLDGVDHLGAAEADVLRQAVRAERAAAGHFAIADGRRAAGTAGARRTAESHADLGADRGAIRLDANQLE